MSALGLIDAIFFSVTFFIFLCNFLIIVKRNIVHCALLLISAYVGGVVLLLLNNSEFLAFVMLTVYVGAVAVLFLFVVMMIDPARLTFNFPKRADLFLAAILGFVTFYLYSGAVEQELAQKMPLIESAYATSLSSAEGSGSISQVAEFGSIIFDSDYSIAVILAAFLLFSSAISVIALTMRKKSGIKRQSLFTQLGRTREDTIQNIAIGFRQGVNDD